MGGKISHGLLYPHKKWAGGVKTTNPEARVFEPHKARRFFHLKSRGYEVVAPFY
jgi:hypothetical protein